MDERQWLQAEHNGKDDLAEIMLACAMTQLPAIEPSSDFVNRAVQGAWQIRTRRRIRRLLTVSGGIATAVAVVVTYALAPLLSTLIANTTIALSHALLWLITVAGEGARWWWIADRIGAALAEALRSPSAAAAVIALEMILLLAIYAFRQVLDVSGEPQMTRNKET